MLSMVFCISPEFLLVNLGGPYLVNIDTNMEAKRRDRVVNIPVSYSVFRGFKSRPEDRLS
jgi:hypothetical protein